MPIITERDGIANYIDLVEGVSMREVRRRGDRHLDQGGHRLEAAAAAAAI